MIKYSSTILFFIFLALFSCKNKFSIDRDKSSVQDSINTEINNIIRKYKLHPPYRTPGYRDGNYASFFVEQYSRTDTCLYILKNSQNDILFFQLGSGIGNYYYHAHIVKLNNDYFFLFRDFGRTKYKTTIYSTMLFPDFTMTEPDVPSYYKIDDQVKLFKIDTVEYNPIQVNRISDLEIINLVKDEFNLRGNFYMVHSPLEFPGEGYNAGVIHTLITIAKDTLEEYQVYYQIKGVFEPRKIGEYFKLFPVFNNIYRQGIFKDNISYLEYHIGWTYHSLISKSYYDYLRPCGTLLSYEHIRTEIIHRRDSLEKILAVLKNEDIFYESNDPPPYATDIIVGIFRYFNGEYFVTVNPEQVVVGEFPPIFHLDTINWVLNKIEKFDTSVDKKYSNLPKKNTINSLIDGIMDWEERLFFESFEIVKVDNEYKLLIK